jgi:hypothetical protein
VVSIAEEDAKAYCDWFSKAYGGILRLPSDAEWECAGRVMNGPPRRLASALCLVVLASCHHAYIAPPTDASAAQFERLYFAWHDESETIRK